MLINFVNTFLYSCQPFFKKKIPFSKEYWINPFSLSHITLFRPMWGWSPLFRSICLISTEIQSLYFRFLISRVLGFIGIAIQLHSQKLQLFVRGPFSSFLFISKLIRNVSVECNKLISTLAIPSYSCPTSIQLCPSGSNGNVFLGFHIWISFTINVSVSLVFET